MEESAPLRPSQDQVAGCCRVHFAAAFGVITAPDSAPCQRAPCFCALPDRASAALSLAGVDVEAQPFHRTAQRGVQAGQRDAGLHAVRIDQQRAVALPPRQPAFRLQARGAVVAEGEIAAGQVHRDVRRVARAAQDQAAAQHAPAVGQQVVEAQRCELRVHVDGGCNAALGVDAAAAQREGDVAGIGIAIDIDAAAPGQRAPAQLAAEFARLDVGEQPLAVAQCAVAAQRAVDRARPVRREVAGVEAGQLRLRLPLQRR